MRIIIPPQSITEDRIRFLRRIACESYRKAMHAQSAGNYGAARIFAAQGDEICKALNNMGIKVYPWMIYEDACREETAKQY